MSVEETARKESIQPEAETRSSSVPSEVLPKNSTMSGNNTQLESTEQPTAGAAHKEETHMEDFATALESYTLETEPAPSEDNVIKGTVLKITATHVVVDIGAKSEGHAAHRRSHGPRQRSSSPATDRRHGPAG